MDLPYDIIFCALVAFYPIYTYIPYYVVVFYIEMCMLCAHFYIDSLLFYDNEERTRKKKHLASCMIVEHTKLLDSNQFESDVEVFSFSNF